MKDESRKISVTSHKEKMSARNQSDYADRETQSTQRMKINYIYVLHRIHRPLKHTFRHQNQFSMSIRDKVIAEKRFLRFPLAAILNFAN